MTVKLIVECVNSWLFRLSIQEDGRVFVNDGILKQVLLSSVRMAAQLNCSSYTEANDDEVLQCTRRTVQLRGHPD